jgi:DNA-binding beta-propeller fold protein YncE
MRGRLIRRVGGVGGLVAVCCLFGVSNALAPASAFATSDAHDFTQVAGSPFSTDMDDAPTAVAFRPGGRLLASAEDTGDTVSVFSVSTEGTLTPGGTPVAAGSDPVSVAFSPNGQLLATANGVDVDDTVSVFSVSPEGTLTAVGPPGATAIEIGTTAQQQAGAPVTLLPCPGAAAPGCFTAVAGSLVISPMPALASPASVSVTVVTQGLAAAASYMYANAPAAPGTRPPRRA